MLEIILESIVVHRSFRDGQIKRAKDLQTELLFKFEFEK